jgi:predicted HicB family RNase H-like nuclease
VTRTKDIEYFLSLPYRIEIDPIPAVEGGGYEASVPELGRYAVCAEGDTIAEALHNLEGVKRERLAAYIEEGLPIPEPERDAEAYSGKFVVRIPKYLHRDLSLTARDNNVSLNQLVATLLASSLEASRAPWTRGGQGFPRDSVLTKKVRVRDPDEHELAQAHQRPGVEKHIRRGPEDEKPPERRKSRRVG